ncbi:MAG: T9SS type A sorting domain-containing protein [Bacteroidetes bacterium]|nr:MAG: T9SS type A sorting domain-containing protein [Bacteroidota bacterium]
MRTKIIILTIMIIILSVFPCLASDNIYWYMGGNQTNAFVFNYGIQIYGEKNRIYTSSRDANSNTVITRVFDLQTQNFIEAYNDIYHQFFILSPGGKYYMLGNGNVYDIDTGDSLYNFFSVSKNYNHEPFNFAISSNEKYIFEELSLDTTYMYELQNGNYIMMLTAFSDDMANKIDSNANRCTIDDYGRFQKYNLVNGEKYIDTVLYPDAVINPYSGDSSYFSGDWELSNSENFLLVNNYLVNNLKVYDLRVNKVIFDYNYKDSTDYGERVSNNFAFSLDESCIINWLTTGKNQIESPVLFISMKTGDTVKIIKSITYLPPVGFGGFGRQYIAGISHDNRYLYITGTDEKIYDFYDLEKQEEHPVICNSGEILKTAFSHDNKTLFVYELTDGGTRIQTYDVTLKKRIWLSPLISYDYNQYEKIYYPFAMSSNDKYIAISTDYYAIYLIPPLEYSNNDEFIGFTDNNAPITCLAFSDDEKYLASGNTKGIIFVWDIEKKNIVQNIATNLEEIFIIKFTGDDEIRIVTADGEQVYSISTGKQINKFTNPLYLNLSKFDYYGYSNFPVSYSNDGNYCAYGYAKNGVNVYNTISNDTLGLFDTGEVLMVAFSDDNKYLATSYKNENYIKIWDFQNKKEVARYDYDPFLRLYEQSYQDTIWAPLDALTFSHDGKYVLGGNYDGSVIIWENTYAGVDDKSDLENADFEIYPNPASSSFRLKYESKSYSKIQISIFDMLGNEVFKTIEDCNIGMNEKLIDCYNLETGYYIIRLKQNGKVEAKPVMILK